MSITAGERTLSGKITQIINDIYSNPDEVVSGEFRGQPDEVVFYIKGDDAVIATKNREFVTLMKGRTDNGKVKDARNRKM